MNRYRKYRSAYIEGILLEMASKVELELKDGTFNCLLDNGYCVDYLSSPMVGTSMMAGLLAMLERLTDDQPELVLVPLPLAGTRLAIADPAAQFQRWLYRMGADALEARRHDTAYFIERFHYDPFIHFPLLFPTIAELRALLMATDGQVQALLHSNAIAAPVGLGWMLLFDFDLDRLQLFTQPEARRRLGKDGYFTSMRRDG